MHVITFRVYWQAEPNGQWQFTTHLTRRGAVADYGNLEVLYDRVMLTECAEAVLESKNVMTADCGLVPQPLNLAVEPVG